MVARDDLGSGKWKWQRTQEEAGASVGSKEGLKVSGDSRVFKSSVNLSTAPQ